MKIFIDENIKEDKLWYIEYQICYQNDYKVIKFVSYCLIKYHYKGEYEGEKYDYYSNYIKKIVNVQNGDQYYHIFLDPKYCHYSEVQYTNKEKTVGRYSVDYCGNGGLGYYMKPKNHSFWFYTIKTLKHWEKLEKESEIAIIKYEKLKFKKLRKIIRKFLYNKVFNKIRIYFDIKKFRKEMVKNGKRA